MAGQRVDIILRDGTPADVPEEQLQQALEAGAEVDSAPIQERRGQLDLARSTGGQVVSGIMGADEAILGLGSGVGFAALEAIDGKGTADETRAAIREMRDENPLAGLAGNAVAGAVLGGPSMALEGLGSTTAARVGATALGAAVEGGMQGLGHAMVESNLGNPEANAEGYFADQFASNFLLGGAVGLGLGGLGEVARGAGSGLRKNAKALGEVGAEAAGDVRAGRELVGEYRAAEGAVDQIMSAGKYTLGEARKVVSDVEKMAKQSLADETVGGVFEKYVAQVAKDDPTLASVMRTQFDRGAQLASKGESKLDDLARGLAERGDKMLEVEQKLYDESITAKGRKMAELVDPTKRLEAMDTSVSMIRNVRQVADEVEDLAGGKGLSRAFREESDRFEAVLQGKGQKLSAAESKAAEALSIAEENLSVAKQARVEASELAKLQKARDEAQRFAEKAGMGSSWSPAKSGPPSAADIFMAADNFKRNVGKLKSLANGQRVEGRIQQQFELLYEQTLRAPLENEAVWGAAAASAQREVNEAWANRLATRNDLGRSFLRDFGRDMSGTLERADAGKFRGFLSNISAPGKDLDRQALTQWLDGTEAAMAATERHYGSVAEYNQGRKAIAEMRSMLEEAEGQAKTIEALQAQKLSEGEGIGGALGLVSDVFVRPLKTAERLAAVKQSVDRVGKATSRVVEELFGTAKQRAADIAEGAKRAASREQAKEAGDMVKHYAKNPEGFLEQIAGRLEGLASSAPEHARATSMVASRALTHLAQYAPVGHRSADPLRKDSGAWYTESEVDDFARRLRVVEDPLSVVRDAANGTLSVDQVQTLKEVYPSIYENIREKAWAQIQSLQSSGKIDSVPYSQRLNLGILLDLPSDSSMEPDFIAMIQSSKPKPEPQEKSQERGNKPARRNVQLDTSNLTTESARIESGGDP